MSSLLELSEFMFSVGDEEADQSFFEKIKRGTNEKGEKLDDHVFYRIVESYGGDKLYGIEIRIGENSKYSPEVIDSNDFEIKKNPKGKELIETDNQVLLFFQIGRGARENRMWTSKPVYNNKIREIFAQKTGVDRNQIKIVRVYGNPEIFIAELSKINKLVFSLKPDTMLHSKDMTREIESVTGFGAGVHQYIIQTNFEKNCTAGQKIKDKLLDLVSKRDECEIDGLIIAGKDTEDNNMILNHDCVTNKIKIRSVYPDDNGFFRFEEVRDEMEKKIK